MTSKALLTILGEEEPAKESRFNYTGHGVEGKNYDPDLGIKDISKRLKAQFKKEFPKCKFSVQIQRYSMGQSLHISLMEAPFEAIICDRVSNWDDKGWKTCVKKPNENNHASLNQYSFNDSYEKEEGNSNGTLLTRQAWDVMARVTKLTQSFNFDDSDGMIDYFHTNFYLHLNIGKWDKPFQVA